MEKEIITKRDVHRWWLQIVFDLGVDRYTSDEWQAHYEKFWNAIKANKQSFIRIRTLRELRNGVSSDAASNATRYPSVQSRYEAIQSRKLQAAKAEIETPAKTAAAAKCWPKEQPRFKTPQAGFDFGQQSVNQRYESIKLRKEKLAEIELQKKAEQIKKQQLLQQQAAEQFKQQQLLLQQQQQLKQKPTKEQQQLAAQLIQQKALTQHQLQLAKGQYNQQLELAKQQLQQQQVKGKLPEPETRAKPPANELQQAYERQQELLLHPLAEQQLNKCDAEAAAKMLEIEQQLMIDAVKLTSNASSLQAAAAADTQKEFEQMEQWLAQQDEKQLNDMEYELADVSDFISHLPSLADPTIREGLVVNLMQELKVKEGGSESGSESGSGSGSDSDSDSDSGSGSCSASGSGSGSGSGSSSGSGSDSDSSGSSSADNA